MKRNRNMVRTIIVIVSVLALLMAGIIAYVGFRNVRNAYYDSFADEIKATAIMLDHELANKWLGDWSVDEDGKLYKGHAYVYEDYKAQIADLHERTGIHFTLFIGDTRIITSMVDAATGESLEGTKAGSVLVEKVLNGGESYLAEDANIGGENWYAYYMPLRNSDGTIVGMIFAGRDTSVVDTSLKKARYTIIGVFSFFFFINLGIARLIVHSSSKSIKEIVKGLKKLEGGELDFYIPDKTFNRKDELGVIAESSAELRDKLQDVIAATKELSKEVTKSGESLSNSATTASDVADQVAKAVEDISRGAVSQAESVENSMNNTNEMGDSIDDITSSIDGLTNAANVMLDGANRTVNALTGLMSHNEDVKNSMEGISAQIRQTNDSVKSIAEASSIITSISSQTNLLSLNASIEAARAGEYGRGFAVVATEIGSLAEQSKQAAVSINQIVETLVQDSEKSVETIEKLSEEINKQNNQLVETKADMDRVVTSVDSVDEAANVIKTKIHALNSLKAGFVEIIEELSAISQQNAASSEETNASMEELNATFNLISEAAVELRNMAETLEEKMSFFTLDEEKIGA